MTYAQVAFEPTRTLFSLHSASRIPEGGAAPPAFSPQDHHAFNVNSNYPHLSAPSAHLCHALDYSRFSLHLTQLYCWFA